MTWGKGQSAKGVWRSVSRAALTLTTSLRYFDRIDRWKRNLALASLNVPLDRLVKSTNSQEIFLNSNRLAQECAVQEVLFDIIQFSQNRGDSLSYQLIPVNSNSTQLKSVLPLLEIQPMLTKTIQAWQEWERRELASYPPSLFPIVQKSEQVFISSQPLTENRVNLFNSIDKRILVVDDDRNIREVISMCLHKLKGWEILTAASGQEGLNGISTNYPHAIVLDMMMPEMDGLTFLRHLRSDLRIAETIPVVILTASRHLPDKELLTELGVVEIVSKPFLPIDLVRQIDRALESNLYLLN